MNEIEKKYFEAFLKVVKANPKITLFYKDEQTSNYTDLYIEYTSSERDKTGGYIIFHITYTTPDGTKIFSPSLSLTSTSKTIDGYIPDFVITNSYFEHHKFAIEIDGHQWHEKTKEQAISDRKKDRAYLNNLVIPIRFTGSDVFHDAKNCVLETLEVVGNLLSGYIVLNLSEPFYQIQEGKKNK